MSGEVWKADIAVAFEAAAFEPAMAVFTELVERVLEHDSVISVFADPPVLEDELDETSPRAFLSVLKGSE